MDRTDIVDLLYGGFARVTEKGEKGSVPVLSWTFDEQTSKFCFTIRGDQDESKQVVRQYPHLLEGHPYASVILASNLMASVFAGNESDTFLWSTLLVHLDSKRWIDTIWYLVFVVFGNLTEGVGHSEFAPFVVLAAAEQRKDSGEIAWAAATGALLALLWCCRNANDRALLLHVATIRAFDNDHQEGKDKQVQYLQPNYLGLGHQQSFDLPLVCDTHMDIPTRWSDADVCRAVEEQEDSAGLLTCLINPCILKSICQEFSKWTGSGAFLLRGDGKFYLELFKHHVSLVSCSSSSSSLTQPPPTSNPIDQVALMHFIGMVVEDAGPLGMSCVTVPSYTLNYDTADIARRTEMLQRIWDKCTLDETNWLPDIGSVHQMDLVPSSSSSSSSSSAHSTTIATTITTTTPGKQSASQKKKRDA
jgi:hypothetical protein